MEGSIKNLAMRVEKVDQIRLFVGSVNGKIYTHLMNIKDKFEDQD